MIDLVVADDLVVTAGLVVVLTFVDVEDGFLVASLESS